MITLNYDSADGFVQGKRNLFWNGWEILHWKPNPSAYTSPKGAFLGGRWGILTHFPVNSSGEWTVPDKYAR